MSGLLSSAPLFDFPARTVVLWDTAWILAVQNRMTAQFGSSLLPFLELDAVPAQKGKL